LRQRQAISAKYSVGLPETGRQIQIRDYFVIRVVVPWPKLSLHIKPLILDELALKAAPLIFIFVIREFIFIFRGIVLETFEAVHIPFRDFKPRRMF
jgi:hypothetical protein